MTEKATFGAGCFWGVEEAFREVKGVLKTTVGYMGGHKDNPTYEDVCTGRTGHAEVVQIEFDPKIVSYKDLLKVFWAIHDPTQKFRQGPDIGNEYRGVIFYHSEEQDKIALQSRMDEQQKYDKAVVTDLVPAQTFWKAEDYHQKFLMKKGMKTCEGIER